MKIKNYIWLTFFFLLASQVVNSQLKAGNLPVFDFSKKYSQQKFRLQDMADIEYVPLETTDDILLSGNAVLSAVTDKYILVYEPQRGDIFVFNRNTGRLYSHFNHIGQSGQEYAWISAGAILDKKKEEIYVCAQAIQVYSLKGEYKRTLKISTMEYEMKVFNFDDETLLIYDGVVIEPGREKSTKKDPYRLVSKKDGSLVSMLNIRFSKRYSNTIAQNLEDKWRSYKFYYPSNMHYGSDLMIADISSDTLYHLSPDKRLIPILTRKPSVHASEPRSIWFPLLTTDKFLYLGTFLLDFNSTGGKILTFMYQFDSQNINEVFIKDVEYDTRIGSKGEWTSESSDIDKNMAAELIQASSVLEAYKGKRLAGNGMKIAKKLVEDDNPVVRIIKFK